MTAGDFGDLVRRRREAGSLSVARLGRLVGRAPDTVRSWERGRSVPSDPAVLVSLAAALGIDEVEIFRAAGVAPPVHDGRPTIEQELATLAPSGERTSVEVDQAPVPAGSPPRRPRGAHLRTAPTPERGARSTRVDRPVGGYLPARDHEPASPAPVIRVDPAPPPAPGSYLEDPEERATYRIRAAATAAAVVLLAIVLVWASARLGEALGGLVEAVLG